jgi:predicted NUDIX family NTP pyrophosphohydrolase
MLVGHMGGPFWSRKDAGAWTIPKGEYEPDEDPLDAAKREFLEEIGVPVPATSYHPLGSVKQSGGKIVSVWAAQGDLDETATVSGMFTMEWPPRSGVMSDFPELDRTAWVTPDRARELLVRAQVTFVDRLVAALADGADPAL